MSLDHLPSPVLDHLDPEQRAAASAPPGPVLCIAPAGSGKTTTLVARLAWLLAGTPPGDRARPNEVCLVTFNRRAAAELAARTAPVLTGLGLAPDALRIRTFHALAREILLDAGLAVEPLVDRESLLRDLFPNLAPEDRRRLDDAFSRLKIDHDLTAADVAADPDPSPLGRAFLRYEAAIADLGGLDFDDLVCRARRALETSSALLARWRLRCRDLLVDEVQDVDRAQLRLALLLAAPANRVFFVGDDDQTIYAWRLADVRRILDLDRSLPGLRQVGLVTNYRCPAVVVERAVRLVERNRERFPKTIRARPGAEGRLVLAPLDAPFSDGMAAVEAVLDAWEDDGRPRAILARTNRELLPAVAVALDWGLPFRISQLASPLLEPGLERLLEAVEAADPSLPLLRQVAAAASALSADDGRPARAGSGEPKRCHPATDGNEPSARFEDPSERLAAELGVEGPTTSPTTFLQDVLGWAARFEVSSGAEFAAAVREQRRRLAELWQDDASLTFSTVHGAKGLEFDDVAVLGLSTDVFPNPRSVASALEPDRALEEERRLAYVAWTRARRSLTLVFDPRSPSPFLTEAFDPAELGLTGRERTRAEARAGPAGHRWPPSSGI